MMSLTKPLDWVMCLSPSLLGTHDEGGEGQAGMALVLMQRLMSQQEAVVQYIQGPEERRVDLHLTQQPGSLLVCLTHINTQEHTNIQF